MRPRRGEVASGGYPLPVMVHHPSEPPRGAGTALRCELAGRRVLVIGLGETGADGARRWLEGVESAISSGPDLEAAAASSGPALAAALFAAAHRSSRSRPSDGAGEPAADPPGRKLAPGPLEEPSLVVSVGDAVRRAVPTAARATISARAPLRAGLTEAQVGGPFGRALGAHADALVLLGRAAEASVIRVLGTGAVEVQGAPADQVALGASARARRLCSASPRVHAIVTGPGAQAGLPFANLSSFDGGDAEAAPSVVGRGGLGAVLAGAGVMALTVEEAPVDAADPRAVAAPSLDRGPAVPDTLTPRRGDGLEAALVRSPRLLSRAAGGTLELAASRGSDLAVDGPRRKHGCAGCPTPCGWTFQVDSRGGSRVGGRFSALQGFAERGEPLELLERCNHLGVDARSVAGLMSRFPSAPSDEFFSGLLDPASEVHIAAQEGAQFPGAGATFARGDLAAEVGQALAVRGPEPLRSLSILGLDGERARGMIAPLPWSGDRERDAGTLAFWHECVAAAVDVSGFCSFSAAGLLADGVMGVSELGESLGIEPEGGSSSAAVLLRSGARHLALHRELLGAEAAIPGDLLERHPAAVEAYLAARDGQVDGGLVGGDLSCGKDRGPAADGAPVEAPVRPRAVTGPLTVVARGLLGARLAGHPGVVRGEAAGPAGDEVRVELAAPATGWTAVELLAELAAGCPSAAPWLLDPAGRPLPAVLEVESGATAQAPIRRHGPGAAVELVLAIPGG